MRTLFLSYGLVAYFAFLVAILYAIGFIANVVVPKGIDAGETGSFGRSVAINILLLACFGLQHSLMARPAFKAWWTRYVPRPIERSTFVLISSLIFFLLYWQWRPLPESVWHVENSVFRAVLWGLSGAGWALVLYSSFVIDHFDLFGLRQVYFHWRGIEYTYPSFSERSVYRWVRHPLMLGFMIAFWSTPDMSQGHLLFAVTATLYVLVAIQLEERDLVSFLGQSYSEYRRRTPMLFPWKRP